ncbi:MAG: hypothetical protein HYZ31_11870 [Gammaproteobacteria bacterium]|jgi:hypothetical protein|nr:hypothetical protein [Gammaproteobacteria bacterium]
MSETRLRLDIEISQLEKFCNQLLTRSRDIVKTHESLITLETFIKVFASGQQGSESYMAIEALIGRYTEQTRQQLLQQKNLELISALQHRDVSAVAAVHTPLSRNGFYLILQSVGAVLPRDELGALQDWSIKWTQDAKQKADKLSRYPDAPDFKAAGIVLEQYLAMVDVSRYLESLA